MFIIVHHSIYYYCEVIADITMKDELLFSLSILIVTAGPGGTVEQNDQDILHAIKKLISSSNSGDYST